LWYIIIKDNVNLLDVCPGKKGMVDMGSAKEEIAATRIYTHEDIANFPDNEIWELLEGVPYQMAPPTVKHQQISEELFWQFANYLRGKGKPCEVYTAPFGVYLPNTRKRNNFVVPDLTIVYEKIEDDQYYGVPPLVIEIVSPSNKPREMQKKLKLYQELGIREYWLIYLDSKTVTIYRLNQNNRYEIADAYIPPDPSETEPDEIDRDGTNPKIKVGIFDDLWIDFELVF
jgi:Uma2 family endonuclease